MFMQLPEFGSERMNTVSFSVPFLEANGNLNLSLICIDCTKSISSLAVDEDRRLLEYGSKDLRRLPNDKTDRSSPENLKNL